MEIVTCNCEVPLDIKKKYTTYTCTKNKHLHDFVFQSFSNSKEVSESTKINSVIVEMNVEYQNQSTIKCSIEDKTLENRFTIRNDDVNKNCKLILLHTLDYTVQSKYNVTVSVTAVNPNTRRKRQIYGKGKLLNY